MKPRFMTTRQVVRLLILIFSCFHACTVTGAESLKGHFSDGVGEITVGIELVGLSGCTDTSQPPHCSHYPGARTLVKSLDIKLGRRKVFVPIDVIRALYDPTAIAIVRAPKGGAVIQIRGGDASSSYTARIHTSESRVHQLEVFELGADRPILRAHYYSAVVP